MIVRKDAVSVAVAGLLACSGFAFADGTVPPKASLTLDPAMLTADEAPPQTGLLMSALDKIGAAKPLTDNQIKIYGWIEGGYTWLHRHHQDELIIPGPFNHEFGNHFMLNQLDLRFEKSVDPTKLDIGGMIELMYGSDAARIHATGLGYDGSDATDDDDVANVGTDDILAVTNLHPIQQFDIPQAYVDVNLPVGNGLKFRVGKFVTLLGYETIDPRTNPFYSHSYLFSAVPFTHVGVLAAYQINDQWAVTAGITRGWDIALEDNNGSAIDSIGQIAFTPNKQWQFVLNYSVGPENSGDSSHYRTVIDPIVYWQVTDAFKLGLEGLYLYDGGINGDATTGVTHAYGDVWGAALYAGYKINDYFTLNGRLEKAHSMLASFAGVNVAQAFGTVPALNAYETTLGVTITPMPRDPIGKNLTIRPEIRYDWTDSTAFKFYQAGGNAYKDQLTFGADVIFQF